MVFIVDDELTYEKMLEVLEQYLEAAGFTDA